MKTILIVDDSGFMRNLIKKCISELDISVVGEAENGKVALEKYIELSPDIVTLDLAMADHDGTGALKAIIQHDPNAKVVVVSSTADSAIVINETLSLGAHTVLNKPIDKSKLTEIIAGLINE